MSGAERRQIEWFLELLDGAPQGVVTYPDQPDAVVTTEESCIAIEHTRIIRRPSQGYNLRAHESRTDSIARKAQVAFEDAHDEALRVRLSFDDRVQLARSDEERVAKELAEVVSAHLPPIGDKWLLERWRFQVQRQPFPSAVQLLWVHHAANWRPFWSVMRTSMVPELTVDVVQERINDKETKFKSYRQACSEVWLLLVVEGSAPSSHWSFDYFPAHHVFNTSFSRVFVYQQFDASVMELCVSSTPERMLPPGSRGAG